MSTVTIECPDGYRIKVQLIPEEIVPGQDYQPTGRLDSSATDKQRKMIFAVAKAQGIQLHEFIARVGADSLDELGSWDVQDLMKLVPPTKPDDDVPF